jgi:hypothetical protein
MKLASLPIFCKSEGEIFALAPASDGGAAGWVWRDGSWVPGGYVGASWDGISLSRDEVISLIGRAAVEALPKEG